MKKVLQVVLALVVGTVVSAESKWTTVAKALGNATVFIEGFEASGVQKEGSCTGWVIDAERKYVLTAAHCDAAKVLADGLVTYKMFKDERKDLLVLRVATLEKPALKLAAKRPDMGDQVASYGFGFALEKPMFRVAHISNTSMQIEELSGPFTMLDSEFIGGQSGGPVVNEHGEVVMIVQRSADGLGIGVDAETIRDKAGRFFGK